MRRELGLFHVRHVVGPELVGFAEGLDDLFLGNAAEIGFGGRLPPVGYIEVERIGKFMRVIGLAGGCAGAAQECVGAVKLCSAVGKSTAFDTSAASIQDEG
jgi:hypothetical protein